MKHPTKTGECEGCTVKRKLSMFEIRFYGSTPGGHLRETWLCESCSKVLGLHELLGADNYVGKLLLMVNSKLDLMKRRRK